MPDALHKYAAGDRYSKKPCVLDVRGSGGFDQYICQSQKFGHMGWFYSCHGYHQRCCGDLRVLSCVVVVPACTPFFGKRTVVYYPLFWIFLIVLIVVTFVVWMAPILEPYNVPNFNGVSEMYPVVLIRLVIFEWLFYCFFVPIIEKRGTTQDIETVVLGDHTLKVLDILYVQAMEHRVCIYTKEGELVERSRFRDLMQILNDIDGVQPHRSYWVPTHAILHLEGDADRLNIVLTSGDKIAVARTRRSEIEEWAKEKTLLIRVMD